MEQPKKCRKCGSLDIAACNLRARVYRCRACNLAQTVANYAANRARDGAKVAAWYAANRRLVIDRSLARQRGCTLETLYRCRASRCIVCNIAPWTHKRYKLGPMQCGHLVPGDDGAGHEPMCRKCNGFLGVRALTEQTGREVLRRSRRYWSFLQMRDENWQHTDVDARGYGVGGINESPGRQRRLDGFEDERRTGTD